MSVCLLTLSKHSQLQQQIQELRNKMEAVTAIQPSGSAQVTLLMQLHAMQMSQISQMSQNVMNEYVLCRGVGKYRK